MAHAEAYSVTSGLIDMGFVYLASDCRLTAAPVRFPTGQIEVVNVVNSDTRHVATDGFTHAETQCDWYARTPPRDLRVGSSKGLHFKARGSGL